MTARQPDPAPPDAGALHFFPHYAGDVHDYPLAIELRRLGVPHRFFAHVIDRTYRSKFGLIFGVYPRLLWFALSYGVRSLVLARPRPAAAIVGTDIEALVFGLLRRLCRSRTLIVFETLIITPRRSPLAEALYRRYYGLVLRAIDLAICHSQTEVAHYRGRFPDARCRFACVPYGTTVFDRAWALQEVARGAAGQGSRTPEIVSAGRSGRDYRTLAEAVRGLPCRVRIICDVTAALGGVTPSAQIAIDRNCFGRDYIKALAGAQFVVVPLSQDDVSAGQMVLLQARALGRTAVISRTRTTVEYATDGVDALLVGIGDAAGMRAAISRLLDDAEFRETLGAAALRRFERENSTEAYIGNLVAVVHDTVAAGTDRR